MTRCIRIWIEPSFREHVFVLPHVPPHPGSERFADNDDDDDDDDDDDGDFGVIYRFNQARIRTIRVSTQANRLVICMMATAADPLPSLPPPPARAQGKEPQKLYLVCRMDKGLMLPDELSRIGSDEQSMKQLDIYLRGISLKSF